MSFLAEQRKQLLRQGSQARTFHQLERDDNQVATNKSHLNNDVVNDFTTTTNQWENQTLLLAKQGTESAKRARKLAEEARMTGILTAENLGKQTEQLESVQDDMEAMHNHLEDAEHIIHEIEGGFFGNIFLFRKPFKAYKRSAVTVETRTVEETRKGIGGIHLEEMKTGKTDKNDRWAVVKNQERRKNQEVERKQRESNFKNPLSYLWNWWIGTESSFPVEEEKEAISKDVSTERITSHQEEGHKYDTDEKYSQSIITGNSVNDNIAPRLDKYLRKQDEELDRIGSAVKDMKEIALRMNEELNYQERVIDNLQMNVEDAGNRLRGDLRRVNRI